jgi:hypothetical protein
MAPRDGIEPSSLILIQSVNAIVQTIRQPPLTCGTLPVSRSDESPACRTVRDTRCDTGGGRTPYPRLPPSVPPGASLPGASGAPLRRKSRGSSRRVRCRIDPTCRVSVSARSVYASQDVACGRVGVASVRVDNSEIARSDTDPSQLLDKSDDVPTGQSYREVSGSLRVNAVTMEKAHRAWDLRVAGRPWSEIAATVGYSTPGNAIRAVERYYGSVPPINLAMEREVWRARVEHMGRISERDVRKAKPGGSRSGRGGAAGGTTVRAGRADSRCRRGLGLWRLGDLALDRSGRPPKCVPGDTMRHGGRYSPGLSGGQLGRRPTVLLPGEESNHRRSSRSGLTELPEAEAPSPVFVKPLELPRESIDVAVWISRLLAAAAQARTTTLHREAALSAAMPSFEGRRPSGDRSLIAQITATARGKPCMGGGGPARPQTVDLCFLLGWSRAGRVERRCRRWWRGAHSTWSSH